MNTQNGKCAEHSPVLNQAQLDAAQSTLQPQQQQQQQYEEVTSPPTFEQGMMQSSMQQRLQNPNQIRQTGNGNMISLAQLWRQQTVPSNSNSIERRVFNRQMEVEQPAQIMMNVVVDDIRQQTIEDSPKSNQNVIDLDADLIKDYVVVDSQFSSKIKKDGDGHVEGENNLDKSEEEQDDDEGDGEKDEDNDEDGDEQEEEEANISEGVEQNFGYQAQRAVRQFYNSQNSIQPHPQTQQQSQQQQNLLLFQIPSHRQQSSTRAAAGGSVSSLFRMGSVDQIDDFIGQTGQQYHQRQINNILQWQPSLHSRQQQYYTDAQQIQQQQLSLLQSLNIQQQPVMGQRMIPGAAGEIPIRSTTNTGMGGLQMSSQPNSNSDEQMSSNREIGQTGNSHQSSQASNELFRQIEFCQMMRQYQRQSQQQQQLQQLQLQRNPFFIHPISVNLRNNAATAASSQSQEPSSENSQQSQQQQVPLFPLNYPIRFQQMPPLDDLAHQYSILQNQQQGQLRSHYQLANAARSKYYTYYKPCYFDNYDANQPYMKITAMQTNSGNLNNIHYIVTPRGMVRSKKNTATEDIIIGRQGMTEQSDPMQWKPFLSGNDPSSLEQQDVRLTDIALPHTDRAISRLHCKIVYKDGFRIRKKVSHDFMMFLHAIKTNNTKYTIPDNAVRKIWAFVRPKFAFYIVDIGSAQGTFLKIKYDQTKVIEKGQVFLVGADTQFHILGVCHNGPLPMTESNSNEGLFCNMTGQEEQEFLDFLLREKRSNTVIHGLSEEETIKLDALDCVVTENENVNNSTLLIDYSKRNFRPYVKLKVNSQSVSYHLFVCNRQAINQGFRIGRSQECTIQININTISRKQSRIFYKDRKWHLKDGDLTRESANGTWISLNDFREKIELRCESDPKEIQHGTEIKISDSILKVELFNNEYKRQQPNYSFNLNDIDDEDEGNDKCNDDYQQRQMDCMLIDNSRRMQECGEMQQQQQQQQFSNNRDLDTTYD